jgi:hypothetical protein
MRVDIIYQKKYKKFHINKMKQTLKNKMKRLQSIMKTLKGIYDLNILQNIIISLKGIFNLYITQNIIYIIDFVLNIIILFKNFVLYIITSLIGIFNLYITQNIMYIIGFVLNIIILFKNFVLYIITSLKGIFNLYITQNIMYIIGFVLNILQKTIILLKGIFNFYITQNIMHTIDLVGILSTSYIYINMYDFILSMNQDINHKSTVFNKEYIWIFLVLILLKTILVYFLKNSYKRTLDFDTRIVLFCAFTVINIFSIISALLSFLLYQLKTNCIDSISLKYIHIHRIWKEVDLKGYLLNKIIDEPYLIHQLKKFKINFPIPDEFITSILKNCKTKKDVTNSVYNVIVKLEEEKELLEKEQSLSMMDEFHCRMNETNMNYSEISYNYGSWNNWGTYVVVASAVMIMLTFLYTFQLAENIDMEIMRREEAFRKLSNETQKALSISHEEAENALETFSVRADDVLQEIDSAVCDLDKIKDIASQAEACLIKAQESIKISREQEASFLLKMDASLKDVSNQNDRVSQKINQLAEYHYKLDANKQKLDSLMHIMKKNGLVNVKGEEYVINIQDNIRRLTARAKENDNLDFKFKCLGTELKYKMEGISAESHKTNATHQTILERVIRMRDDIDDVDSKYRATCNLYDATKSLAIQNNNAYNKISDLMIKNSDAIEGIKSLAESGRRDIALVNSRVAENKERIILSLKQLKFSKDMEDVELKKEKIEDLSRFKEHISDNYKAIHYLHGQFKELFTSRLSNVEDLLNNEALRDEALREEFKAIITSRMDAVEEITNNEALREMVKEIIRDVLSMTI